jgi:hypothetical protein
MNGFHQLPQHTKENYDKTPTEELIRMIGNLNEENASYVRHILDMRHQKAVDERLKKIEADVRSVKEEQIPDLQEKARPHWTVVPTFCLVVAGLVASLIAIIVGVVG